MIKEKYVIILLFRFTVEFDHNFYLNNILISVCYRFFGNPQRFYKCYLPPFLTLYGKEVF